MSIDEHTLIQLSRAEREARRLRLRFLLVNKSPEKDIALAILSAVQRLIYIARQADMEFAADTYGQMNEASKFVAFARELCRPLDDMLPKVLRIAGDNCGEFSPPEQDELARARFVAEAIGPDWIDKFELKAGSRVQHWTTHRHRYARALELAGRK